ncbi:lysis protein [Pseudomonas sp. SWI6]|uniref:lysis system i-spanin subunit Rz n=1 Tax=Pseudomonas sp. SWI6 TaxID=2083051 RepID=UPI000CE5F2C6|nr:lysis system i-spanin subunit Rz [Pseudomonas sp. SWI6]AVD81235.1 lysis protein [Pseudomonas sp. SWI6]
MTISPIRALLVLLVVGLAVWFAFDQVLEQRNSARSERDSAQQEASGLREAVRISGERLATAAANDLKHTQGLSNDLKSNQALRDSVGAGDQRLRVQATCPATDVRANSGAAGVVDARPAELSPDARSDYFTLLDQLALSKRMILGLQDHIRSFCPTQPNTSGAPQ